MRLMKEEIEQQRLNEEMKIQEQDNNTEQQAQGITLTDQGLNQIHILAYNFTNLVLDF